MGFQQMGLIFDIKRYSINDGPGIRVTIFFKGCPLSCIWCHNPEGISPRPQKLYTRSRCIGCGACIAACPRGALKMTADAGVVTDPAKCNLSGECAKVCPTGAMEISGRQYSVDELMREISRETIVMDKSGGGVTFSGGEPLLSADLLAELLVRCGREEIHRAVDTTLFAPPETVRRVAEHTDLFLVDLKHMDSEKHKRFCGVPNERIHENLRMVAGLGKDIIIRIPFIEGVNADRENLEASAGFLASLPGREGKRTEVDLLPYHDIGKGKHQKLGTVYNPGGVPMSTPTDDAIRDAIDIFEGRGISVKIGG